MASIPYGGYSFGRLRKPRKEKYPGQYKRYLLGANSPAGDEARAEILGIVRDENGWFVTPAKEATSGK